MSSIPPHSQGQPGPYHQPHGHAPHSGPPGGYHPTEAIRPKTFWFWVGGLLIAAGLIAAVATFIFGFLNIGSNVAAFERSSAGGDTVRLVPRDYVIYTEGGGGLVRLTDPSGNGVALRPYIGDVTYSYNGRSGQAAYTFTATEFGTYQVDSTIDVAFGDSILGSIIGTFVVPLMVGSILPLLGITIIVITAIRRSRAKRRNQLTH